MFGRIIGAARTTVRFSLITILPFLRRGSPPPPSSLLPSSVSLPPPPPSLTPAPPPTAVDEYDPNARREFQPLNKEIISIRTTLKSCLEQGAMTAAEVVDFTNLMQLLCFEQSYGVRWMSLLLALTVVKDRFDAAILDNHAALRRFCYQAFMKFVDTTGPRGVARRVVDPDDPLAQTLVCLDRTNLVFEEVARQGHIPGQLPYVDHCPGRARSHQGAVDTYVVNVQNGLWMNVGTRLFHELKLPRYAFNVAGVDAGPYASLDGKRIRVVVYAILRRGRPPAAVAGFDIEDYPVIANYVRAFRARFTVRTRDNGRRPLLPDEELTDDILKVRCLPDVCLPVCCLPAVSLMRGITLTLIFSLDISTFTGESVFVFPALSRRFAACECF
jgi:hypothetical protein